MKNKTESAGMSAARLASELSKVTDKQISDAIKAALAKQQNVKPA